MDETRRWNAFIEEAQAVAQGYGFALDVVHGSLLVRNDPNAVVWMVSLRQPGDEPAPRMPGIAVGTAPPTQTGLREVNRPIPHPPEFWKEQARAESAIRAYGRACAQAVLSDFEGEPVTLDGRYDDIFAAVPLPDMAQVRPSRDERLVRAVFEECARVAREWSKCDLNFSAGFRMRIDVAAVIAAVDREGR